jgi:hypothetical protein
MGSHRSTLTSSTGTSNLLTFGIGSEKSGTLATERDPQYSKPTISQTTGANQRGWDGAIDLGRQIEAERIIKRLRGLFSVQTVPIHTLASTEWKLAQPLSVSVEQRGANDFIACLYDIDLYGYGDTIPEALDDLKEIILDQFEYLSQRQQTVKLGAMPRKQLEFLANLLVRKDA